MVGAARDLVAALVTLACAAGAAAQGLTIIDNPALGEFDDISSKGTPLPLGDDGETGLEGSFEGNFVFRPGMIVVGQNGGVAFGQMTVTDLSPVNEPIPSPAAFVGGQAALVLWDDIDDKEGDVLSFVARDRLIVQWNWTDFDGRGGVIRFQVQVFPNFEPTGIYAQLLYQIDAAESAGAGATVGYQDGRAGFGDAQFSFNEPGAVEDGTVLTLAILASCPADVDQDGHVAIGDLLAVIQDWGCTGRCRADVDLDGGVGVPDLVAVIGAWGECPE